MKTKDKNGFEGNDYSARIRIKPVDLDWLKGNKDKKSAAAFLAQIIEEYRKPNLFKRRKFDR